MKMNDKRKLTLAEIEAAEPLLRGTFYIMFKLMYKDMPKLPWQNQDLAEAAVDRQCWALADEHVEMLKQISEGTEGDGDG